MKKVLAVLSSFVLFAALGHAQNCGAISDEAGKIDNPAAVKQGIQTLVNQGANVHLVTVTGQRRLGTFGLKLRWVY